MNTKTNPEQIGEPKNKVCRQLHSFFRELRDKNLIQSVKASLAKELVDVLNANGPANDQFKEDMFRKFDQTAIPRISEHRCIRIRDAIPKNAFLRQIPQVREIYNEKFHPSSYDVGDPDHSIFRLRPANAPPLAETCKLHGDYIFYRPEFRVPADGKGRELSVSRMFYRFWKHPNREIRVMGLPHLYGDSYLGLRGWLVDLETAYLAVGHAIDRRAEDISGEQVRGGISSLSVTSDHREPHVVMDDENLIVGAPALHHRAIHRHEVSSARGYLVRVRGFEGMVNTPDDPPESRYTMIKELQDCVNSHFGQDLSMTNAAGELSQITGYNPSVFYSEAKDGRERGLLTNRVDFPKRRGAPAVPLGPLTATAREHQTAEERKSNGRPKTVGFGHSIPRDEDGKALFKNA